MRTLTRSSFVRQTLAAARPAGGAAEMARATAPGAGRPAGHGQLQRGSANRVQEVDASLEPQIVAAPNDAACAERPASTPRTTGAAGPSLTAEHLEQVGEVAEAEIELAGIEPGERVEPGAERRVAASIVLGPLLLVGEDGKGLGDLLELLLGRFLALVDVRVILARQPAVGRLDLLLVGAS